MAKKRARIKPDERYVTPEVFDIPRLSVRDVAEIVKMPEATVRNWARNHVLAHTKMGKRIRFFEKDVREMLSRGRAEYVETQSLTV